MTYRERHGRIQKTKRSDYDSMLSGVATLLEEARRSSARAVNAIMTARYWVGGGLLNTNSKGNDGLNMGSRFWSDFHMT